jgi:succinate dehydrogenase/fumarate reductase flavoprotein subunit
MSSFEGTVVDTDVLVIGAGAGGLLAALSAKRHGGPGTRVTLVDTWTAGRTGHTAFSNAWTVVVLPDDDLETITNEIIRGNDWVADQPLVREVLATSFDRLRDLEGLELEFPRDSAGDYVRRPTRGLDATRVMYPTGGGLEFATRLRRGLEIEGVEILDRVFITGLMRGGTDRVIGAVGINSRTGHFYAIKARATIVCTNAITFRSGFVRDITGTGTLLAYKAGATLRNAEFSYTRPSTPNFYFEGITFAIQEGARFVNSKGERFMERHEPIWGDQADVPRVARAMAKERQAGNDPLYLDMSGIPEEKRQYFISSKVKWMANFFYKLGDEAKTDMFGKTPYYALNQMTKMGIRTDGTCRSDVPGLLSGGLAQAGCANHFAGFHIGMSIGTGWIAGRSAVEDLDRYPAPVLDAAEVHHLHDVVANRIDPVPAAASDRILREVQAIMFAYDVSVWKSADRLTGALEKIKHLKATAADLSAPHVHELVRLHETEAMLLAAELILEASLARTESRLSHFREDFDFRDDQNWLKWIDLTDDRGAVSRTETPIPTPLYPVDAADQGAAISRLVKI